eukprot:354452-Chlamydomonas_euryale.AAC.3
MQHWFHCNATATATPVRHIHTQLICAPSIEQLKMLVRQPPSQPALSCAAATFTCGPNRHRLLFPPAVHARAHMQEQTEVGAGPNRRRPRSRPRCACVRTCRNKQKEVLDAVSSQCEEMETKVHEQEVQAVAEMRNLEASVSRYHQLAHRLKLIPVSQAGRGQGQRGLRSTDPKPGTWRRACRTTTSWRTGSSSFR